MCGALCLTARRQARCRRTKVCPVAFVNDHNAAVCEPSPLAITLVDIHVDNAAFVLACHGDAVPSRYNQGWTFLLNCVCQRLRVMKRNTDQLSRLLDFVALASVTTRSHPVRYKFDSSVLFVSQRWPLCWVQTTPRTWPLVYVSARCMMTT